MSRNKETERKRMDRELLKRLGICLYCYRQDAAPGRTLCLDCLEKHNARSRTYQKSTETVYKHRQHLKRRRDLLRAFGVCIVCGKHDAKPGHTACWSCLENNRVRSAGRRAEAGRQVRSLMGTGETCYFCGKPVTDHEKVCEACYERCRQQMLYARSKRNGENYFEKQCRRGGMEGHKKAAPGGAAGQPGR